MSASSAWEPCKLCLGNSPMGCSFLLADVLRSLSFPLPLPYSRRWVEFTSSVKLETLPLVSLEPCTTSHS